MYINFKKVIIHNFLSYGHAEIDLNDKSYCLVRGINNNPLDNALSNGSGKSSWSSAICWCLTGETINGLRSGLKNIYIDEKECYVTLYFSVDKDEFEITRYKEPKTYLKVVINGVDKSGKTFRDSELVLNQYLPDLTSQLLGSVIILGQGLPGKFTANTPAGRKEVLEKLSKSDFMIQDIKNKLNTVMTENNTKLREFEDTLLAKNSQKSIYLQQKETNTEKLAELSKPVNFEELINETITNITNEENLLKTTVSTLTESASKLEEVGNKINQLNTDKNSALLLENNKFQELKAKNNEKSTSITTIFNTAKNTLTNNYNTAKTDITTKTMTKESELNAKINSLEAEIKKLDSITDVCPTCGQKLIGVTKPDTTAKKAEVLTLKEELKKIVENKTKALTEALEIYNKGLTDAQTLYNTDNAEIIKKNNALQTLYNNNIAEINEQYTKDVSSLNLEYKNLKDKIQLYTENKRLKEAKILDLNTQLSKLKIEKDNHQTKLKEVQDTLLSIDNNLKKIEEEILYNNNEKVVVEDRLAIDKKIDSLIKRDFRGFLLSNIINFINKKAKEYSSFIFGSDKLDFILDGNNIDISYSDKAFENLSGGEKQKVDLIIQFAIRDMMSEYLQFSSNILILDEIFDNLDSNGCNSVINLLSKKLNDVESLFIISHHADELEISYDCELIIEKNRDGISKVR